MPGWYVQGVSRGVVVDEAPQDRLLHVALDGVGVEGSSLSSSRRGSGAEDWDGGAIEESVSVFELAVVVSETAIGFSLGRLSSVWAGFGAGVGVSSTVECLPVVHGGSVRNSSNVRTRGLQHL